MSFWGFIGRLIILDWLFGGHGNRSQCSSNHNDCQHDDNYLNNDYHYGGYDSADGKDYGDPFDSGLSDNDYSSNLLDDDYGSGMLGDDYGSGMTGDDSGYNSGFFDDDTYSSGMSGDDF